MICNYLKDIYSIKDLNQLEGSVEYKVLINPSHEVYKLHFPDHPVTPGACILEILKDLSEKFLKKNLSVETIKNIKYLDAIIPNDDLLLSINLKIKKQDQEKVHVLSSIAEGSKVLVKSSLIYTII